MIQPILFAFVAVLSSFGAVNGAIVQRDGLFTDSTPSQPSPMHDAATPSSPSTADNNAVTTPPTSGISTTRTSMLRSRCEDPCDNVTIWQAHFAYSAGDVVSYHDEKSQQTSAFTAKQWNWDSAPPEHPDEWFRGGCPKGGNSPSLDCSSIPEWQNNVAYTAGDQVVYQSLAWGAVQWTQGNSPGDASGSWKSLGGCTL